MTPPAPRELPLLVLILGLERRHHARVRERGRIAKCSAFGDVAQQASHNLALARLGKVRREEDVVWPRKRANLLRDELSQFITQR